MKIICDYPKREMSIANAIEHKLDSDGDRDGQIERAIATSSACTEMIGKIVQMLYDNQALSKDNIKDLIGYNFTVED